MDAEMASHGAAENGDKNAHFVMFALLHRVMRKIMRADFVYFCATLTTHFSSWIDIVVSVPSAKVELQQRKFI